MPRTIISLKDRLLSKIKEDENGCWIWQGTTTPDGYGQIRIGRATDGKSRAHRVSYEIFVSKIPDGYCVCHRCDTPLCVNPSHLFCGTHKDNTQDMIKKGRNVIPFRKGENNGNSKLNEKQILEIRSLYREGYSQTQIANDFGVSKQAIHQIVNKKNWAHIPEAADAKK